MTIDWKETKALYKDKVIDALVALDRFYLYDLHIGGTTGITLMLYDSISQNQTQYLVTKETIDDQVNKILEKERPKPKRRRHNKNK